MTINLSPLLSEDAFDYSASAAEMGENAGAITWDNAKRAPVCLKTPEELARIFALCDANRAAMLKAREDQKLSAHRYWWQDTETETEPKH